MIIFEITSIGKWQKSHNGNFVRTIGIKEDGTGSFYRTFVCPDYANYNRNKGGWKSIRVGQKIWFKKLMFEKEGIINADSMPFVLQEAPKINLNNPEEFAKICR